MMAARGEVGEKRLFGTFLTPPGPGAYDDNRDADFADFPTCLPSRGAWTLAPY